MKDTNTTLVVGLLAVIIVALATMLAIVFSKTDPVVLIGFAGTIVAGLLAFLRAGQAADEASRAKKEAASSASTVQEIKISIDGRMEELLSTTKQAASNSATLVERNRGEAKAADLAVATGTTLAAAQAAPANPPTQIERQIQANADAIIELQQVSVVQALTDPVPVVLIQPEDMPVAVKVIEESSEKQEEGA